ncbi:MAG: dihydropteroate synthase, partial [Deltaproteobacteria bacterium]|nr:dihydropteroate synthase [Deltaproteobacteria bacterium]
QRVLIMGVVNVTPDSFSDGGRFAGAEAAIAHGLQLAREGADIVDVGGEATGPKSTPVDEAEELRRVLPVVEGLVAAGLRVSIDTTKAAVAAAAVERGATIVNDISGGVFDPAILGVVERSTATYICGHLRGRSIAEVFAKEGQEAYGFDDVVGELAARLEGFPDAVAARTWLDPGIGFGKTPALNMELVSGAGRLGFALDRPVVIGPSRKRFLRQLVGGDPSEADLDQATVAACGEALAAGPMVLRVHNVALLHAALTAYNNR